LKFNKKLADIKTYEAGKPIELVVREFGIKPQNIIKLASNENPYGTSKKVQKPIKKILNNMYMYPDDSMFELKDKLAKHHKVDSKNIIIGSGSDQIIEFIIHAKANKNNSILINNITFAMYEIYAKQVGTNIIKTTSKKHNLDEFYELYKKHSPAIIFLCTPNNPTGDALDKDEVFEFLDKIDNNTLVVIDGAYMEYAKYKDKNKYIKPKKLLKRYENVIYLGTFSKAYGLGGMRVGYGIASQNIIQALYKLRPPFNVTTLSLEAAKTALDDIDFIYESIKKNFKQMKRYEKILQKNDIDFIPSWTNFVTIILNSNQNSSEISNYLLKKGIIVRDLASYNLNAIRVTIGNKKQNDRFFQEFLKLI